MVPPQNLKKLASSAPSPRTGSSMPDRCLILRRAESVPLPNRMDQEIASAINRARSHQQAPAHIRIMKARRNAKGVIMAITHQKTTAVMVMRYREIIITAARTVDKLVMDVKENETWERRKIHAVPLVQYIEGVKEGLQKMREEFDAENEGIVIPNQVRWLENPNTIREMRQNGEIAASSVVCVVIGSRLPEGSRRLTSSGAPNGGPVWGMRFGGLVRPGTESEDLGLDIDDCTLGYGFRIQS